MDISLKSQRATSRNVSSSCSTTFWFTVRGSPGERGHFLDNCTVATTTAYQWRQGEQESIQKSF